MNTISIIELLNREDHCPDCGAILVPLPFGTSCPHCGLETEGSEEPGVLAFEPASGRLARGFRWANPLPEDFFEDVA